MTKHILYLASGSSKRFGENKLFYPLNGKPLYRHGMDMLMSYANRHEDCTLTVVSRYEKIRELAKTQGINVVDSPESEKGVSYTIKAGLKSLENVSEDDFVMFVVADQPYLSKESVERLMECAREGTETASMIYGDRLGNPTLFSAKLIPELLELEGDVGGRAVIRNHQCVFVQAVSETELNDIDTKEDILEEYK